MEHTGGPPVTQWAAHTDTRTAYNRFVRLSVGQVRVRDVRRPPAGSTRVGVMTGVGAYKAARAAEAVGDFVRKESREAELLQDVEHALATGVPMEGFLSMTRSLTGGVRVVPHHGKAFTLASTRAMARMLDLNVPAGISHGEQLLKDWGLM